jgi:hypothetical protein
MAMRFMTHYFGVRGMLRRDELDAWLPTIFTTNTWDRRSNTKAAVKAKKAKDKARDRTRISELRTE